MCAASWPSAAICSSREGERKNPSGTRMVGRRKPKVTGLAISREKRKATSPRPKAERQRATAPRTSAALPPRPAPVAEGRGGTAKRDGARHPERGDQGDLPAGVEQECQDEVSGSHGLLRPEVWPGVPSWGSSVSSSKAERRASFSGVSCRVST